MGPLPFRSVAVGRAAQPVAVSALLQERCPQPARGARCDPGTPRPRASMRPRVRGRGGHKKAVRCPKAAPHAGRRGRHSGRIDRRPTAESQPVPVSRSLPSHRLGSLEAVGPVVDPQPFIPNEFHAPCNHYLITELPPRPVTRRSRSADHAFAPTFSGRSARIGLESWFSSLPNIRTTRPRGSPLKINSNGNEPTLERQSTTLERQGTTLAGRRGAGVIDSARPAGGCPSSPVACTSTPRESAGSTA